MWLEYDARHLSKVRLPLDLDYSEIPPSSPTTERFILTMSLERGLPRQGPRFHHREANGSFEILE